MKNVVLSNEDFKDFPIGEFPYDKDHTAMGEYQYVVEGGYHGNWVDMVCNYTYNGTGPTWLITERDGRHFMESMRIEKNRPHRMFPTLETGKHQRKNYEVSVSLRRLSQKGMAGLVFSMNHSIDTLVFYLEGKDKAAVAYCHKEELQVLKDVSFPHNCDREYRLKVDCDGRTAKIYVDNRELFRVEDDLVARIVARDRIGHAQRVSIANYCQELEGREIVVTNFWGHQGVIFLYDCYGNQIWEMENEMNGNILAPVNWDGDGTELILTNAEAQKGGLINGKGVRAVEFPDDGHPVLCCESLDLTGDERDELVVWDYHSMYIYTQNDCPKTQTYHPVQFPIYNASNYRGEYSYPDASYLDFHADKEKMKGRNETFSD